MIDQILFMIMDIYTSMAFVMIAGLVLFFICYILAGKLKPRSKLINILGVFTQLNRKDEVRLAFSVLKFLYIFSLLIQLDKLQTIQYILLAEVIIVNMVLYLPKLFSIKSLLFDTAVLMSLFVLNSLCSFKDSLNSDVAFYIILVTASLFIVIFEYYRFIDEVSFIVSDKGVQHAKAAD